LAEADSPWYTHDLAKNKTYASTILILYAFPSAIQIHLLYFFSPAVSITFLHHGKKGPRREVPPQRPREGGQGDQKVAASGQTQGEAPAQGRGERKKERERERERRQKKREKRSTSL